MSLRYCVRHQQQQQQQQQQYPMRSCVRRLPLAALWVPR